MKLSSSNPPPPNKEEGFSTPIKVLFNNLLIPTRSFRLLATNFSLLQLTWFFYPNSNLFFTQFSINHSLVSIIALPDYKGFPINSPFPSTRCYYRCKQQRAVGCSENKTSLIQDGQPPPHTLQRDLNLPSVKWRDSVSLKSKRGCQTDPWAKSSISPVLVQPAS